MAKKKNIMNQISPKGQNKAKHQQQGMKEPACPVCGKIQWVDLEVQQVMCAQCLITGEAPRVKNGIQYHSPLAYLKLVSAGIDTWTLPKDKEAEEKKLIKKFNTIGKKEDSLIKIQRKLGISWPKTKKLEGYRLLDEGWKREDIAKELQVNLSTVSRWKKLQKKLEDALHSDSEEKMQHSNLGSGSSSPSSRMKNDKNPRHPKTKINYNFSAESLNIAFGRFRNEERREKGS